MQYSEYMFQLFYYTSSHMMKYVTDSMITVAIRYNSFSLTWSMAETSRNVYNS